MQAGLSKALPPDSAGSINSWPTEVSMADAADFASKEELTSAINFFSDSAQQF